MLCWFWVEIWTQIGRKVTSSTVSSEKLDPEESRSGLCQSRHSRKFSYQFCGARITPEPMSSGLKPGARDCVPADASTIAKRYDAVAVKPEANSFCVNNAATPVTCGVAILVPLLLVSPPPTFAEMMSTPGAAMFAPTLEKGAIFSPAVS